MRKLKLVLVSFLISSQAFAGFPPTTNKGISDTAPTVTFNVQAPNSQMTRINSITGLVETGNQNVIINPNASGGTAGYTASGGTFTTGGTGTKTYFSWDSNAAAQTVASGYQTITASDPWSGQGGVVSAQFQCAASSTCTHVLRVYDGTNILASQTIATINETTPKFGRTSVNFTYPASGTVRWELASVASNEPIVTYRGLYMGLAEGFNLFEAQGMAGGNSIDYSLPIGAVTTAPTANGSAIQKQSWSRSGGDMLLQFVFSQSSGGSAGSGTYLFPLPTGYTIRTSGAGAVTLVTSANGLGASVVGSGLAGNTQSAGTQSAGNVQVVPYNASSLALSFDGAGQLVTKNLIGSGIYDLSGPEYYSFTARVPISGWSATYTNTAYIPNVAAANWSGYQSAASGWSFSTTSYAAPSAGGTITTTASDSRNITCSAFGTAAGITCTLPSVGKYKVCAQVGMTGSGSFTLSSKVVNGAGTTDITKGANTWNPNVVTSSPLMCGSYQATSLTESFQIFGAATSSNWTIAGAGASGTPGINWTVEQLDAQGAVPIIVGPVYTLQKFTSGTAQTYTTPAGVRALRVRMVGGGAGGNGGGTGGGQGGLGGDTIFGSSLLTASGAPAPATINSNRGVGGAATLGSGAVGTALAGGDGSAASPSSGIGGSGGSGGSNSFGGGGGGGNPGAGLTAGGAGVANSGAGGGGGYANSASAYAGGGGGAGGFIDAMISSPSATYTYTVGAGGTSGAAGTGGGAGGAGGAGYIEITEYYGAMPVPASGAITTNSSAGERIETANITGTTCTIASQSGTWLTTPVAGTTGLCSFTIVTNMFSAAPRCWATNYSGGTQVTTQFSTNPTTTALATKTVNNGAVAWADFMIGCAGPK